MHTAFNGLISSWLGRREANVAMLAAFMIPVILALVGVAVDFQNTIRQKEKVQASLDSAVLAGALQRQRGMSEVAVRADVQQYAASMISQQGGGLVCAPITVSFDAANQDIAGTVTCEQPTYLTQIIGHDELVFTVDATSTYGIGVVDVAFIFDVSGSMNSFGRLPQLKTAAVAAIDELLPDDRVPDGSVRLAITSYNHSLNAGPYINAVTDSQTLAADATNTAARANYDAYNDERMIDSSTGGPMCSSSRRASRIRTAGLSSWASPTSRRASRRNSTPRIRASGSWTKCRRRRSRSPRRPRPSRKTKSRRGRRRAARKSQYTDQRKGGHKNQKNLLNR
jgi:Flp pilus assembly protein TadG